MANLITLSTAQTALAASLPSDTSFLSSAIGAASKLIQRYCRRDFVQTDYTEFYNGKGYSKFWTRQYPVNSISRLSISPVSALTVANTATTTNSRAWALLATTGDFDGGLTVSGMTLSRTASGVTTTNTLPFFGAPTSTGFSVATGGSSGTIATGTYLASYSVTNAQGESPRSADVTISVTLGDVLTYTLPALPTAATGYNLYLSTLGGDRTTETVQATATATGATVSALVAGAAPTGTDNSTLTGLAAAINALSGGWSATVADGFGGWATADLNAPQGAQGSLGPGPTGAAFYVYQSDVANWILDPTDGMVQFNTQTYDPIFALMTPWNQTTLISSFPPGWQSIRCEYNAGFATIPGDIQHACLVTVQAMLMSLQTQQRYDSETAGDWTAKLAGMERFGLPDEAKMVLNMGGWRSFRGY